MEYEPLGQFSDPCFSIILIQVALIVFCRSPLFLSLLSNSFLTAALHALILFGFYLLIFRLWLSCIGCISSTKYFVYRKQAAGTLHQQQAAEEAQ